MPKVIDVPKGAIRSIEDLLGRAEGMKSVKLWAGSPTHGFSENPKLFTGAIGTDNAESSRYHFFEYRFSDSEGKHKASLQDMNVIRNGYNDWFLFTDPNLAERYSKSRD